jgi:hypothetical protein
MNHTSSSAGTMEERAGKSAAEPEMAAQDARDSYPARRISSFPPLEDHAAQDRFLRSPSAVLESIGLRVPAALAQHIRRSSVPPPPAMPAQAAAPEAEALAPVAEAQVTEVEAAPARLDTTSAPTQIPPARKARGRAAPKKKKPTQ